MSYTALYRKWRPSGFSDVKGQDHIVRTLKNQITSQRIGHAYLFCGTRGTGKTSIAKIFARAVNCENPEDGSPCGKCRACMNIGLGASLNVVEIDAASNNGVENIRDIREQVQYPPTEGKYRVYIIDEVHMLSTGAFNALLKTLEEPPSYVIFILATTEVHRIPITVLSRCQRYDFKRITIQTLTDRLKELSEAENIDVEEKALSYIARVADGSMRDALSLLFRRTSYLRTCAGYPGGSGHQYIQPDVPGRGQERDHPVRLPVRGPGDPGERAWAVCDRFYLVYEKSASYTDRGQWGRYAGYVRGQQKSP